MVRLVSVKPGMSRRWVTEWWWRGKLSTPCTVNRTELRGARFLVGGKQGAKSASGKWVDFSARALQVWRAAPR